MPTIQTIFMIVGTIGTVVVLALILSYYTWKKHKQDRLRNEHSKGVLYYLFNLVGVHRFQHAESEKAAVYGRRRRQGRGGARRRSVEGEAAYLSALKRAAEADRRRALYLGKQYPAAGGGSGRSSRGKPGASTGSRPPASRTLAESGKEIRSSKKSVTIQDVVVENEAPSRNNGATAKVYTISDRPQTHVPVRRKEEPKNDEMESYV